MWNHTIRKIVISTGAVTTIAGSPGISGSADGTGSAVRLYGPAGITTDGTNLYVADSQNHTIRKIIISTGVVTTIAGSAGLSGSTDGTGTSARFYYPRGITTDGINVLVADYGNHTIRKIVIATGTVTTLAGSAGLSGSTEGIGSAARFNSPNDITTDGTNLFVADTNNYTIRKIVISTGDVVTVVGSAGLYGSTDGTGSVARFYNPAGLITDGTNLFIADGSNFTIRKVVLSTDTVTTIAGSSGISGSSDGTGSAARFNLPRGITTDGINLFVTDWNNTTIRKISPVITDSTAPTTTTSPAGGTYNATQSVTLTCSDGTGSGCDNIYYTTNGSTPSTLSTVYTTPITVSATTTLKFFAVDPAGNSEAEKTETYVIDSIAPVFSSTAPSADSFINTAAVGYTLSEAVASGSITFTRTGGTADSSPHAYNFTASDKASGSHSINTGLALVSGSVYTVTFDAVDLAGNAVSVSNTGITYDSSAALVTITAPASNSVTNSAVVIYTLNEEISGGDIVFTRAGGTADGMSPHTYTLTASDKTAGSHTINTGLSLVDGGIYTISFENVTDKAGNATTSVSNTGITYDSTAVAVTNTSPAANAIITSATVGYTLSEAASSGMVTFTWTGGSADSASTHAYTLSGADLYVGSHTVNTNLTLVDGAFYTVSFDATDYAGNPATTVSNAMVYYDSGYGTGPVGNVDSSGASAARVDGFDLIKLSLAFGSRSGDSNWNPACDLDGNGAVDGNDLVILGSHFGEAQ